MYSRILKTISLACTLLFVNFTFAQTVINYEAWIPPNPNPCNIFATPLNINNIPHQSTLGQPQYNKTAKAVILETKSVNDYPQYPSLGTEYNIKYLFKKGYQYKVTINARMITSEPSAHATLGLYQKNANYASGFCKGPETIIDSYWYQYIYDTVYKDYTRILFPLGSENNYLYIAGIPDFMGGVQTVAIRKLTITEIPPTFSLNPTAVNKVCGAALNQVFTVNNIDNFPYVSSYEWDLGSADNGWTYNGQPAPQYISTQANNISLSAAACTNTLKNVSVTVKIDNKNYKTYSATTSLSLPNLSISGEGLLCNTAKYAINNLPCNANVTWSSSPNNYISLDQLNGSSTNVKKLIDGTTAILSADITGCGINKKISKKIDLGTLSLDIMGIEPMTKIQAGQILSLSVNSPYAVSYSWSVFGGKITTDPLKSSIKVIIDKCKPLQKQNNNFTAYVTVKNTCGTESQYVEWTEAICNQGQTPEEPQPLIAGTDAFSFTVSPNPAKDNLYIKIFTSPTNFNEANKKMQYGLYDFYTNHIVIQGEFSNKKNEQRLDIKNIRKGKYILIITTDKERKSKQVIIE